MKRLNIRLGISVLFTCAAVVEIMAAIAVMVLCASFLNVPVAEFSISVWLWMFSIIIGGMTAWFVNKVLLRPIKRLSSAMDEVAKGNFDIQLESGNRIKEIKNIYDKFNLMTKELRATEILQSDFVSNVSHEIKTPITSIEGYTMLLQSEETSEEDKKVFIDKILFNTRRLSELVGNILLLSKIDNQAIEAKKRNFRLDEQIRQSILMFEQKWVEKEIVFDVDLMNTTYKGNEPLLQHVWNNLISNAIKFSPQGGKISMRLVTNEASCLFVIEDEGVGIKEEHIKKIFHKFYQVDDSRRQEGNGLGLTLAKKILDISGGEIFVETLPDRGCRFTVKLHIE